MFVADFVVWKQFAQKHLGEDCIRLLLFGRGKCNSVYKIFGKLLSQCIAILSIPRGLRRFRLASID
jgi:hypothetical protein